MYEVGNEVVLEVKKVVFEGKSLANDVIGGDFVFFISPFPVGTLLRAKIWKVKRNFALADVLEVLKKGDGFQEAYCRHFILGECGGCSLQNFIESSELEVKKLMVKENLVLGGCVDESMLEDLHFDCESADTCFYYRNKMEFSFKLIESEIVLGLHKKASYRDIFDLNECYLFSEKTEIILRFFRNFFNSLNDKECLRSLRTLTLRRGINTDDLLIKVVSENFSQFPYDMLKNQFLKSEFYNSNVSLMVESILIVKGKSKISDNKVLVGNEYYIEKIRIEKEKEILFKVPVDSFFQPNVKVIERMIKYLRESLKAYSGGKLVDMFRGVGSIGLCLSDLFTNVIGFEIVDSAVSQAAYNAKINKFDSCSFSKLDLLSSKVNISGIEADVLVVDPPRSGLTPTLIFQFLQIKPRIFVYVSCNPVTLSRDLKLIKDGGYEVNFIRSFDQFPRTFHVETIVILKKSESHINFTE